VYVGRKFRKESPLLKVIELFAGIGSQTKALKRLGVEHEVVCIVEWDKYAYASYQAVHGSTLNLGDISKVEKLPPCDLLTYSFPCQDISLAGGQAGIAEGTRSGLLWEVERLLKEYEELPTYLLLENVKNLIGKKHRMDFEEWLWALEELGYNNYWKVLNAKDYGVPQNRERVFVVSIRKDKDKGTFAWPEPFDNGLRLKDFLETEVDEKYYLEESKVEKLLYQLRETGKANSNPSGRGMGGNVHNGEIAPTLTINKDDGIKVVIPCITPDREEKRQNGRRFKEDGDPMFTLTGQDRHGVLIKANNQKGFDLAEPGDTINFENLASKTRRGRVGKGVAQTINTMTSQAVVETNEHFYTVIAKYKEQVKTVLEPLVDLYQLTEGNWSCDCNRADWFDDLELGCGNEIKIEILDKEVIVYSEFCNQAVVEPNDLKIVGSVEGINGHECLKKVYSAEGISPTLDTMQGGNRQPKVFTQYRIRKLTPLECWRLMGFDDEDFEWASMACSNSQLYKQAGNSIVVDVLEFIFKEMLK
jgi:DNA-cytosine methyltransferase